MKATVSPWSALNDISFNKDTIDSNLYKENYSTINVYIHQYNGTFNLVLYNIFVYENFMSTERIKRKKIRNICFWKLVEQTKLKKSGY